MLPVCYGNISILSFYLVRGFGNVLFLFIYVNYVLQLPLNHSNIINFTSNKTFSDSDVLECSVCCL